MKYQQFTAITRHKSISQHNQYEILIQQFVNCRLNYFVQPTVHVL